MWYIAVEALQTHVWTRELCSIIASSVLHDTWIDSNVGGVRIPCHRETFLWSRTLKFHLSVLPVAVMKCSRIRGCSSRAPEEYKDAMVEADDMTDEYRRMWVSKLPNFPLLIFSIVYTSVNGMTMQCLRYQSCMVDGQLVDVFEGYDLYAKLSFNEWPEKDVLSCTRCREAWVDLCGLARIQFR